ncbi:hypothetical protein HanRHA438_Chr08g0335011 [Helianthus annuus]|nr:hypothetical protein HanRHA438_Chr08g0335011 [Helianthus annuus]
MMLHIPHIQTRLQSLMIQQKRVGFFPDHRSRTHRRPRNHHRSRQTHQTPILMILILPFLNTVCQQVTMR